MTKKDKTKKILNELANKFFVDWSAREEEVVRTNLELRDGKVNEDELDRILNFCGSYATIENTIMAHEGIEQR